MSIINNYFMAADSAVKTLARRLGKDIGNLANLPTDDKTSVVASINEVLNHVNDGFQDLYLGLLNLETEGEDTYAKKTDLSSLVSMDDFAQGLAGMTEDLFIAIEEDFSTKDELTQAITDLINGADADSDTLKELADKITALAQADNGLVSAGSAQTFNATQKKRARDNIDAAAKSDIPDISGLATKAESDTNYHKKAVTYTRTEMDSRYYTKTMANSTFAKVWTGTLTQYNAITTKDGNTIYIVT